MTTLLKVPRSALIRSAYDLWSLWYDGVASPLENSARIRALDAVQVKPHEKILDVGSGTGKILARIAVMPGRCALACGVDFSNGMIRRARRQLDRLGASSPLLIQADARAIPLNNASFDVLYSSYVLDLLSAAGIEGALAEFLRVLRPGGRLALVSMTTLHPERDNWYERLYRHLPASLAAYALGGCRPVTLQNAVIAAGFVNVTRHVVRQAVPSEIVLADRA